MLAPVTLIRRPLRRPSDALPRRTESRTDPRLKMARAATHAPRSTEGIVNVNPTPRTARLPASSVKSRSSVPSIVPPKLPISRMKRTTLPVDRSKASRAPSSIPMMTITEAPAAAETMPSEVRSEVNSETGDKEVLQDILQEPVPASAEKRSSTRPAPVSPSPPCSPVHPSHPPPPPYLAPPPSSLPIDALEDMPQRNQTPFENEAMVMPNEDDVIVLENKMTSTEAKRLTKNQLMDELRERNLPFRANERKDELVCRLIAAL